MSTHIHGPVGALLVAGFFLEFSGVIRLLKKILSMFRFSDACRTSMVCCYQIVSFLSMLLSVFAAAVQWLSSRYGSNTKGVMFGVTIIQC